MEVLVADDGPLLCLPELPVGSHPGVEEQALERTAEGVPARGELLHPACRVVRQQAERVRLGRRAPDARQNASGCSVRFVLVRHVRELVAGVATLDQQRAELVVELEETHRADATPETERDRLVLSCRGPGS